MSDNYVSPYGFGPLTDAVIDAVADRLDMSAEAMSELLDQGLSPEQREAFEYWVGEEWWRSYMGLAIDKMEDRMSEFLPEDDND